MALKFHIMDHSSKKADHGLFLELTLIVLCSSIIYSFPVLQDYSVYLDLCTCMLFTLYGVRKPVFGVSDHVRLLPV